MILVLLIPFVVLSQGKQKWVITKVVNTNLQLGVANPVDIDFKAQEKLFIGNAIYIQGKMLFFSKALKKSESYADTVFIGECKTFKKTEDNEISLRYPGDELSCEPARVDQNKCFVGRSFMKLLGNKEASLSFYELKSNRPNFYTYKLCIIKKQKKMGLLLENSSLLLLIERKN